MKMFNVLATTFRPEFSALENVQNLIAFNAKMQRQGYQRKEAIGMYNGELEFSSMYGQLAEHEMLELAKRLGDGFNQECILAININNDEASLVYPNGVIEPLGEFLEVTREEAESSFAFTYLQEEQKYYVCK